MAHTITKTAERPRPFGIKEAYFQVTVDSAYVATAGITFSASTYALGTVKYANANVFLDASSLPVVPVVDVSNDKIWLFREDTAGVLAAVGNSDADVSGQTFYVNVVGVGV